MGLAFDNSVSQFAAASVSEITQGITTDVLDGEQIRQASQIIAAGSDLVRTYSEYIGNPYYAVLQIAQSQIDPMSILQSITRTFQVDNCLVLGDPVSIFNTGNTFVLGKIPNTQTITPSGYALSLPVFVPGPQPLKLTIEHVSTAEPILESNYSWLDTTIDLQDMEVTSFLEALTPHSLVIGTTRIRQNSNPLHSGGWELV